MQPKHLSHTFLPQSLGIIKERAENPKIRRKGRSAATVFAKHNKVGTTGTAHAGPAEIKPATILILILQGNRKI